MAAGTTDFIEDACDALEKNDESFIVVCWGKDRLQSFGAIDPEHRKMARSMLQNKDWQDILIHHLMAHEEDD